MPFALTPAFLAALKFIGLNVAGGALSAIPFMMMGGAGSDTAEQDPYKQLAGKERKYTTGRKGLGIYAPIR